MEPFAKQVRLKLVLGKYRVLRVERTPTGFQMAVDLLQGIKLVCDLPAIADVREGDILSIYTEVLTNAPPLPTPIQ
jgi:hypothetical protein